MQMNLTANAPGGLARVLHGRSREADQNRDDRDHDQELDRREGATRAE
jgi:hypothetical protein